MTVKVVALQHPSNGLKRFVMVRPTTKWPNHFEVLTWHPHSVDYDQKFYYGDETRAFQELQMIRDDLMDYGWVRI